MLQRRVWAFPWTVDNEVQPVSSKVGHSAINLSSENNTNLLIGGVYTMMDGALNRCVLNMPARSPYLFHCLSTIMCHHDNGYKQYEFRCNCNNIMLKMLWIKFTLE